MKTPADKMNEWIRVSLELPKVAGYYICWCIVEPGLVHFHPDSGWQNGFYNDKVSHWMPLPEPPKQ